MTWWGRVEDLPQAEGCETPKAERPKQGTKTPKNKKERKAEENEKTKESDEGEPGRG
jgi:hypothetical protein